MDKKNTTIGVVLLLAAFASMYFGNKLSPSRSAAPAPSVNTPAVAASDSATPAAAGAVEAAAPSAAPGQPYAAPSTAFATVARDSGTARLTTLANDFIEVHFTNLGGAVHDVALVAQLPGKSRTNGKYYIYPATRDDRSVPYVFNALHADPMLAFVDVPGLDRDTAFELVSSNAGEVVYRAVFDHRIEVTRRYSLPAKADATHDPYQLRHETTFRNLTAQPVPVPRVALSLGTATPTDANDLGLKLTSGFSNGSKQTFFARSELEAGSGFFGIGAHDSKPAITSGGPITWATVGNQFFTAILTPEAPATGLMTRRVKLLPALPDTDNHAYGITAAAQFDLAALPAGGEAKLATNLYVGPKEYKRLANGDIFTKDQDKVMQFGFFKWFSQLLLTLMTAVHGWFPGASWAWGWAIVLTTLFLKIVFVPFTLAASRSAKRMQKIQPEMQSIREKFKDNPQKLQAATMELFKKHKVNPMGGCFPILITIPFFIGFFSMLQSTAELRFQPFLWAGDLSAPDTILHVFGLPLNIMPILMGATMVIQMHLTPSPTVDNAQAKMMKFMPYVFALFCYNFSCALALYSTVNGIFTIGQQLVINRMKDDGDPAAATATATGGSAMSSGKPIKNVTPPKKKK